MITIHPVERNLAILSRLNENDVRKYSHTSCMLRFSNVIFVQPRQNIKFLRVSGSNYN